MSQLRVYYPGQNHNSFGVVGAGIAGAARARGLLAGVYQYASPDPDNYQGTDAEVAIVCGEPGALATARFFGHKCLIYVLAANSSKIPSRVYEALESNDCHEIWTPSEWSRDVILSGIGKWPCAVKLVPHGIDPAFEPADPAFLESTPLYQQIRLPGVSFVHLAESSPERKGTVELLRAFDKWVGNSDYHLTLVMAPLQVSRMQSLVDDLYDERADNIHVRSRFNMPPAQMALALQCYDWVVQPSRAEGFGLVPLEALACAVPVIVSDCTGHEQWLKGIALRQSVGLVWAGGESPAPFDGDGLAPTITPHAIRLAIANAIHRNGEAKHCALASYPMIRESWGWNRVLTPALTDIERKQP